MVLLTWCADEDNTCRSRQLHSGWMRELLEMQKLRISNNVYNGSSRQLSSAIFLNSFPRCLEARKNVRCSGKVRKSDLCESVINWDTVANNDYCSPRCTEKGLGFR